MARQTVGKKIDMEKGVTRFLPIGATMIGIALAAWPSALAAQQRPTFTAAARLVPVSVTVRDGRGRPVTGLTAADFEIFSDDQPHAISQFSAEPSAVTTALLLDQSGSMRVSSWAAASSTTAQQLVSWMTPASDRMGIFAFGTSFAQTSPFAAVSQDSLKALTAMDTFGQTSLYDALDSTSLALVGDGAPRRAVVAITDGLDNASVLTAEDVAARAAAIDVPVYVVAVGLASARLSGELPGDATETPLARLTAWTGGQLFHASAPSHASQAARSIITELRQQYLLAFIPDTRPGWHRLTVRTRQHHKTVRARAGYVTR